MVLQLARDQFVWVLMHIVRIELPHWGTEASILALLVQPCKSQESGYFHMANCCGLKFNAVVIAASQSYLRQGCFMLFAYRISHFASRISHDRVRRIILLVIWYRMLVRCESQLLANIGPSCKTCLL